MYEVERVVVRVVTDASLFNYGLRGAMNSLTNFYRQQRAQALNANTQNIDGTARTLSQMRNMYDRQAAYLQNYSQRIAYMQSRLSGMTVGTQRHTMLSRQILHHNNMLGQLRMWHNHLGQQINATAQRLDYARLGNWPSMALDGFRRLRIGVLSALDSTQQFGYFLTRNLAAPLAGFAVASIYAFTQFDKGITRSLGVLRDNTAETRKLLSDAALDLAGKSSKNLYDIADSFYALASSGYAVGQMLKSLPVIESFATASNTTMQQSTSLLVQTLQALGLSSDDPNANMKNMQRLSDTIVKADSLADASAFEFATALQNKYAAMLRTTGKTPEEGLAVLAAYSRQGIKGKLAGEYASRMLRDVQTAYIRNPEAWQTFGIVPYDQYGNLKKTWEIVQQMEDAFAGGTSIQKKEAMLMLGITDRGEAATRALLGFSDVMRDVYAKELQATGATEQQAAIIRESSYDKLMKSMNAFRILATQFGEAFSPTLDKILFTVQAVTKWFGSLSREGKALAANITAITIAVSIATMAFGTMGVTLVSIIASLSFVQIVLISLAALFVASANYGSKISGSFQTLGTTWKSVFGSIKQDLESGQLEAAFDKVFKAVEYSIYTFLNDALIGAMATTMNLMNNIYRRIFDPAIKTAEAENAFRVLGPEKIRTLYKTMYDREADDPSFYKRAGAPHPADFLQRVMIEFELEKAKMTYKGLDIFGQKRAKIELDALLHPKFDPKTQKDVEKILETTNPYKFGDLPSKSSWLSDAYGIKPKEEIRTFWGNLWDTLGSEFGAYSSEYNLSPKQQLFRQNLMDKGLSPSMVNMGVYSPWRYTMAAMGGDQSVIRDLKQWQRNDYSGIFEKLFNALRPNNELQNKIDSLKVKETDEKFQEISLRRFELEGPGGLAGRQEKTVQTHDPLQFQVLEQIRDVLMGTKGRERLVEIEE